MTYEPPESNILYLVDLNKSGISGYKDLEKPPMTAGAEVETGVSVASSDGEVLIEEFASPALGLEMLPAGTFEFYIYGSVSQADGVSEIAGRVYKRTYAGGETELFDFTTGEIESSTDSPGLFDVSYSSSDIDIDPTDRLILKLYGKTDYATAITVNLHYQGAVNQSRIFLPVMLPRFTGGDMASALYDPNLDGYADQSSDAGGGGHVIQDEGTSLTARSNLNFAYGFTVTDDGANDATKVDVTGSSASIDPWISSTDTWALSSSDDPVFVVTVNADITSIIGVGYKVKFTQDATTKYGIVHAVGAYSGGKTPITIYGGTDYTITNSEITDPHYSYARAPLGFPMNPSKWTVSLLNTSSYNLGSSPTAGTWYNVGSIYLDIPIGVWNCTYHCIGQASVTTASITYTTLSTANNSESNNKLTGTGYGLQNADRNAISVYISNIQITTTSKTRYYLNIKTSAGTNLYIRGDWMPTMIQFVSAYL